MERKKREANAEYEKVKLDRRYGKIGISAVAAAISSSGARREPANSDSNRTTSQQRCGGRNSEGWRNKESRPPAYRSGPQPIAPEQVEPETGSKRSGRGRMTVPVSQASSVIGVPGRLLSVAGRCLCAQAPTSADPVGVESMNSVLATWLFMRAVRWVSLIVFLGWSMYFSWDRAPHFNNLGHLTATAEGMLFIPPLIAGFAAFLELMMREKAGLQRPKFGQLIPPPSTGRQPLIRQPAGLARLAHAEARPLAADEPHAPAWRATASPPHS